MYRKATFAIVVSRISMNVGTTTMAATTHGFTTVCRAIGRFNATLLMTILLSPLRVRAGERLNSSSMCFGLLQLMPTVAALSPHLDR